MPKKNEVVVTFTQDEFKTLTSCILGEATTLLLGGQTLGFVKACKLGQRIQRDHEEAWDATRNAVTEVYTPHFDFGTEKPS
jgi:hypothetical protein